MKTITTIGVIYLLAGFCVLHGSISLGWDIDYGHKKGETILKKTPKISLVKREGDFIFIKVENDSGEDLTYDGYAEGDPQCFFKTKSNSHLGMFNDGWAATYLDKHWGGISHYVIKNGKSVKMKVKPMVKICQIYIIMRSKTDAKRFSFVKIYENKKG